ncbi:FAD-dependent thymidylate synthase [bacterium]|nr:FAD-dependent thymidylate synthase [bacterium]
MKIVKPGWEIVNEPNWGTIERGDESTLEHHSMTVRFVCDLGVSHELVRHRHCSPSQESARCAGCNEEQVEFIRPPWLGDGGLTEYHWCAAMKSCAMHYQDLVSLGWKPEQARSVLPNSLKTEVVVRNNLLDWRYILMLRCDDETHPQMLELMRPLHKYLTEVCPTMFNSGKYNTEKL